MRLAVALIAALTVLSGCASTITGSTPPGMPRTIVEDVDPAPAGQLVFQVTTAGGYVPFESYATGRPWLSVYGDGTVFVPADRASRPTGTPVELERATVPRGAVMTLIADAGNTGLFDGDEHDLGDPGITDSASTAVTFRPGSAPARSVSAYALDYTDGDDNLSAREKEGRRVLRNLINRVDNAVVRSPASSSWTPERIDVIELKTLTRTGIPTPWPGPALDTVLRDATVGPCGVITGPVAARVFRVAVAAQTLNWSEGGTVRLLAIRALLPGERGCKR